MLFRVAIGFLLTSALTLAAQQPPAAPAGQQSARFGAATAGVIVDAVARDKRGRPVTDLSQTEFEIYEDGVRQQIVAFEPYTPEDGPKTVVEAARVAGAGTGKRRPRVDCLKARRSSRWRGTGWSRRVAPWRIRPQNGSSRPRRPANWSASSSPT